MPKGAAHYVSRHLGPDFDERKLTNVAFSPGAAAALSRAPSAAPSAVDVADGGAADGRPRSVEWKSRLAE